MQPYSLTSRIYWLCIFITTSESLDCFGHHCSGHNSLCLVNKEHTFFGRCDNLEICRHRSRCTASHEAVHGPGRECCCEDQNCIDSLRDVYTGTISNCFGQRCDEHHPMCVVEREHGMLSGWCEEMDHHHHHHHHTECTSSLVHEHDPGYFECRCVTQQCVDGLMFPLLHCLGRICTGHHPNCEIRMEHGHLVGHCIEEKQCTEHHRGICTGVNDTYGHGGCCCRDAKCVSAATVVSTSAPLTNAPTTKVNPVTTVTTTSVPTTTKVYHDNTTTVPVVPSSSTTATPTVLRCPTCADDFTGDCQKNAECTTDEACMLQVTEGKLQTGCVQINDCEYNARIGDSICCKDKNCTDNAFRNYHDFIFTCPTCQNTQDPMFCMAMQGKCGYMNKGCMISRTNGGLTSGCNINGTDCLQAQAANSPLCNVNPIPFDLNPDLQCSFCCYHNERTCILDALGIHESVLTTTPKVAGSTVTTPPEITGNTGGSVTSEVVSVAVTTVNRRETTKGITMTTARYPRPTTQRPCVDHDVNNNCVLMRDIICHEKDPHILNYAIANCAETCDLCAEYRERFSGVATTRP